MTIEELYEKLKGIYGKDCLKRHYYLDNMELLSNILYQLDYDHDEERNMMAIAEIDGEICLTDLGDTFSFFNQEAKFESKLTIKNLMKKYGIIQKDYAFVKKFESFEDEKIKHAVSDFMCFIFSVWFFGLHHIRYGYPILSRGYYYREEYESQVEFKGEEYLDIIKKCKESYSDFAFDKDEKLFYRIVDGKKKYLVKLFDGFTFNDLVPDKEEHQGYLAPTTNSIDFEALKIKIKQVAGDKFNEDDLSYTTYIFDENRKPLKFYLKKERNHFYFTDKGRAKKQLKKDLDLNQFKAITDCTESKNFDVRCYISQKDLDDKDFGKVLEEKIHYIALTSKDINEFDFSNIGKFHTKINDYETIRQLIIDKAECEVIDEENKCTFITPLEYDDGKNIRFSLEKGEPFCCFTLKNGYDGELLEKLLLFLKDKDISYDKQENKFKVMVYENHEGLVLRKAHKMLEFIIFYTNINKFFRTGYPKREEKIIPSSYKDMCKKLKEIKNYGPFFGFYEGFIRSAGDTEDTKVIFVFGKYYFDPNIARSASVEIRKEGDKYCVRNFKLEEALANANTNEYLLNLVENFDLKNRVITNDSLKMKLSNMVQLVICAQIAKLI